MDDADNHDHEDKDEIMLGRGQKKEGGCSQHLGQHHQAVPSLPAWLEGDYFHVMSSNMMMMMMTVVKLTS